MRKVFLVLIMIFAGIITTSCSIVNDDVDAPKKVYEIKITLDLKKPAVESADNATWYEVSVKNSNDLQYVVTTIKITDKKHQNASYTLIVNNEKINSKKYSIKDNVITYKVDDPNWTEYY